MFAVWPSAPKRVWGPKGWRWLHLEAISFPAEPTPAEAARTAARIRAFVESLPCPECRTHAQAALRRSPPDLAGSHALQVWAWELHNAVNARLKKPRHSYGAYLAAYADEIEWAERVGGAFRARARRLA